MRTRKPKMIEPDFWYCHVTAGGKTVLGRGKYKMKKGEAKAIKKMGGGVIRRNEEWVPY